MLRFKRIAILYLFLTTKLAIVFAQETHIKYELNGRPSNKAITDSISVSQNPFARFIGEWTLKNDNWSQNWGGKDKLIKIPKHHTVSAAINTENTLISIIDGPEPNGQIYWTYNPNTKEVSHLSSFGEIRIGKGKGTIDKDGNVRLKLSFEGEPYGTYRIYNYRWINKDEYHMKSIQYNENDELTGLFYEGSFIRVKKLKNDQIKKEILHHGDVIRKAFSAGDIETIKVLHHPDVIKALGYDNIQTGRDEVVKAITDILKNFTLEFIENEIESILIKGDIAIEQTKFSIKGTPKQDGESFIFEGRTMVTYIGYDKSPTGWATIREIIQIATD